MRRRPASASATLCGIHIGDGVFDRRGVHAAALARGAGEGAALLDRQGEKAPLPIGVPHGRPQSLIRPIVGAQGIAVHHQDRLAVERDDQGIGQQARARQCAELRAQQEIPVAVHDEAGHAAGGEGSDRLDGGLLAGGRVHRLRPTIRTDRRGCRARRRLRASCFRKSTNCRVISRALRVDVQIRDEENRHRGCPAPQPLNWPRAAIRARSSR